MRRINWGATMDLGLAIGGVVWLLGSGVWFSGSLFALRRVRKKSSLEGYDFFPEPISVLKPICGADNGLRENLETFFHQDYPNYEILFCVQTVDDPAIPIVKELIARYSNRVPARLFIGAADLGVNPKVCNIYRAYHHVSHDLVLISDSNIRVESDYLQRMVCGFKRKKAGKPIGMLTSLVAGTNPKGFGGRCEANYLNTFFARSMSMINEINMSTVLGKSMLFRKSQDHLFGGLDEMVEYLSEDFVAGERVKSKGFQVDLMPGFVNQNIGEHTFKQFWARHRRWGRIRKIHAVHVFLLELFSTSFFASIVGGLVFSQLFDISFLTFFSAQFALCALLDLILVKEIQKSVNLLDLIAWLVRECTYIPLWINVMMGNTVLWRGNLLRLVKGGKVEFVNPSPITVQSEPSLSLGSSHEQSPDRGPQPIQ